MGCASPSRCDGAPRDTTCESTLASIGSSAPVPILRRPDGWINNDFISAYSRLHELGWAHSVEVFDRAGQLAGGLYGVRIDGLFSGESMFHLQRDASKVALMALVEPHARRGNDAARRPMVYGSSRVARSDRDSARRLSVQGGRGDELLGCRQQRGSPVTGITYTRNVLEVS